MLTAPQLAFLASRYAAANDMTLAALGARIFNDHRFFKRLASGLDCTTQSAAKATAWFLENWSDDMPWPATIPRPSEMHEDAA